MHEGVKNPISYIDPRANMYQVQYTDNGMKLDINVRPHSDGSIVVESRPERSSIYPHPEHPERSAVFIVESTVTMKPGQSAVLGAIRGPLALKQLQAQYPAAQFTDSDYFLITVTVR